MTAESDEISQILAYWVQRYGRDEAKRLVYAIMRIASAVDRYEQAAKRQRRLHRRPDCMRGVGDMIGWLRARDVAWDDLRTARQECADLVAAYSARWEIPRYLIPLSFLSLRPPLPG